MSIEFIRAGLQTSIQDLGRKGQMHNGLSHSGAMDPLSMQLANYLVGNKPSQATLEIACIGPELLFHHPMTIAVTGALFELRLNQQLITPYQSYQLKEGDRLSFGKLKQGYRAYLACSASFDVPEVFNSQATHSIAGFGGFSGRCFKDGDYLICRDISLQPIKKLPAAYKLNYSGHYILRYTPGLEFSSFSPNHSREFQQQEWQVTPQSNRMGIRLSGSSLSQLQAPDIFSSGLLPGAIQLPSSGQPIIAAVDGQTIGGYPRLAQLIQADLPLLGQVKPGDSISFVEIDHRQAWQLKQQQQKLLVQLFSGI